MMKFTRLMCTYIITAMLLTIVPTTAFAGEESFDAETTPVSEENNETEVLAETDTPETVVSEGSLPVNLLAEANLLSGSEAVEITNAYSAAFPLGTVMGGPYSVVLTYYDAEGNSHNAGEDQPEGTLEIDLPTNGRANAVFAYDRATDTFSFVSSVSGDVSSSVKTNSLLPLIAVSNAIDFQDTSGHWAETHILVAARKGLVTGTGSEQFEPNRNITKAEFSRLITQALQLPAAESNTAVRFSDVAAGSWYYDSILKLQSAGILNAFTTGTFSPDEPITREEMAVMLAGAMDYLNVPQVVSSDSVSTRFTDYGTITAGFLPRVERVVGYGVMNGMTATEFEPQGSATRAQAAVAVTGMLRKFGFIDAINYDFSPTDLYSTSAVVMDWETKADLLSKNQDVQVYPASLTKLMTGLVMLDNWDNIPDTITMDPAIFPPLKQAQSSMAGFKEGETVTKEDLLYGTMLKSGGEATQTLATAIAGSESGFVNLMNAKAQELGLTSTHFVNTTGLHDDQHYTTIRDLKALFIYALENEQLYEILTTRYHTTQPTAEHPNGLTFENGIFDRFEGSIFSWGNVLGGKTGYTGEAGQCLASLVEKNGRHYIMITTGNGIKPFGVRYYTADVATVYTNFIMH